MNAIAPRVCAGRPKKIVALAGPDASGACKMENGDTFAVPHLVLRDAWGNATTMEAHQQVVLFHFIQEC
jgi:hypothetical protein